VPSPGNPAWAPVPSPGNPAWAPVPSPGNPSSPPGLVGVAGLAMALDFLAGLQADAGFLNVEWAAILLLQHCSQKIADLQNSKPAGTQKFKLQHPKVQIGTFELFELLMIYLYIYIYLFKLKTLKYQKFKSSNLNFWCLNCLATTPAATQQIAH
jgi:hypothetical protein